MKKTTMFKIAGIAAGVALPVAMVLAQGTGTFNPPGSVGGGVGNIGNGVVTTGVITNSVQTGGLNYSGSFVERFFIFFRNVLVAIPPILVAVAGVVFMFEVIRFIFLGKDGKAEEKDKIKTHILYSLIALVVLLGFWGIVGMISKLIGVRTGESVSAGDIPRVYITPN